MKPLLLIVFFLCSFFANGQLSCQYPYDGTFYSYPKNTANASKYLIRGDTEIEYNVDTGDSIIYKINRKGDCQYTLQYVSGLIF